MYSVGGFFNRGPARNIRHLIINGGISAFQDSMLNLERAPHMVTCLHHIRSRGALYKLSQTNFIACNWRVRMMLPYFCDQDIEVRSCYRWWGLYNRRGNSNRWVGARSDRRCVTAILWQKQSTAAIRATQRGRTV